MKHYNNTLNTVWCT